MTYPSNIFFGPPSKFPYTLTCSAKDKFSFLLSGNSAFTYMDPESSFSVNPLLSIRVTVPSMIVTGGNDKFLMGVVPAHPTIIKTNIVNSSGKSVFIFCLISELQAPWLPRPSDELGRLMVQGSGHLYRFFVKESFIKEGCGDRFAVGLTDARSSHDRPPCVSHSVNHVIEKNCRVFFG